jgi:hypothetical protein
MQVTSSRSIRRQLAEAVRGRASGKRNPPVAGAISRSNLGASPSAVVSAYLLAEADSDISKNVTNHV